LGILIGEARRFQIGPEFSAALTIDDVTARTSNVEALLDARYRVVDDFEIGLGAGPGLSKGIGTPDFRGVAMLAYSPRQKETKAAPARDRDGDHIFDAQDACPDEPGVPNLDPRKNAIREKLI
jgi:hypothetical protein